MKIIRTVFAAILAVVTITTASPALELHAATQAGLQELTVDLPPVTPPTLEEALTQKDGLDPVVITIAGLKFGEIGWGPLELKNFIRLIKIFFPDKEISEENLINDITNFNKDYFLLENDEDVRELMEASNRSPLPDDYIEAKVREMQSYQHHDVVVAPFPWSRDPGDTQKTVPGLEKKIVDIYDTYKNTGRPIYILAHSWGSVLTHEAMHSIAHYRPDVKVDRLVTVGSPLVPANFVLALFIKLEISKEHLEKAVTKPAGVKYWHNIWTKRDAYSNAIPAADSNYQADSKVGDLEPRLIDLILHNKLLRKQAKRDLFKIRDLKAWHESYFFDYQANLSSIDKEILVQIFRPLIAPQMVAHPAKPAAAQLP